MSDLEPLEEDERRGRLDTLPGLAQVAATAWWHTAEWTVANSLKATKRLLQVAADPASAPALAQEVRDAAREAAREIVGLDDIPGLREPSTQEPVAPPAPGTERPADGNGSRDHTSLVERGEQLLRRSNDVRYEERAHPAYERILSELAPDEGRILRLLLLEGPQPSVDVRTGGPLGLVNSHLIAPGLNMIGPRAGCRYVERVPQYLNNLHRLGLIWFSRETLRDPLQYQVVEAQPEVLEAMHKVRYTRVVRRSIHLTPFGEDFCRVALALAATTDLSDLPAHAVPDEDATAIGPSEH